MAVTSIGNAAEQQFLKAMGMQLNLVAAVLPHRRAPRQRRSARKLNFATVLLQ
jgi:hypothetical protein